MLKAYQVRDKTENFYASVVFAETAGKARAAAMHTDACEDVPLVDISVRRIPALDSEYRGHIEMDWYDDQDRRALVKEGWHCEDTSWECDGCLCKDICGEYLDEQEG